MTYDQIMNITSFAVSIGLGIISIALAIFAIWLSRHFDSKSSSALDAIKDLASEIRNLTHVQLSQQQNFSTKMLDSIISHSEYGVPTKEESEPKESALVGLIREELTKTELRISSSVDTQVRQLFESKVKDPSELDAALRSIKEDISKLGDNAIQAVGETVRLPVKLRDALKVYRDGDLPAFFVLLSAILREQAKSPEDIKHVEREYSIPDGWEGGLERLLEDGILQGNTSRFHVTREFMKPLKVWIERNWHIIRNISDMYANRPDRILPPKAAATIINNLDL